MHHSIGAVVPVNIDRPKRIAKALDKLFHKAKLSQCQAVTAHLFGFADWHGLEQAIKSETSRGPFDEEISAEQFEDRRAAQVNVIAEELGEVDFAAPYPPPGPPKIPDFGYAHSEKRLLAAHQRCQQLLAFDAICELTPTSSAHPVAQPPFDALCLYKTDELSAFPANLARWWRVNVKHQPEVANAIANFEFDVNRGTSILSFAQYWGTLCMYYANTINWQMIMGTSYLLAEGYAAAHLPYTGTYDEILPKWQKGTEEENQHWLTSLTAENTRLARNFYRVFPRDDLFGVMISQPKAFLSNAKTCKKILASSRSRRGVWKQH